MKRKSSTLMKKLIRYFMIIIVLMFLINVYSMYGFKSFYSNFSIMLRRLVNTHSISVEMDNLYQQVDNYTHSGTLEYVDKYREKLLNIKHAIVLLKNQSSGDLYYKFRDIENMLLTFQEMSIRIIEDYDAGTERIYLNQSLSELSRLKNYINDEIKEIILDGLLGSQAYYSGFKDSIYNKEILIYELTAVITILCIAFAFKFSKEVSNPIHQLVLRLKRVAEGELDVDEVTLRTNDEINVLIDSFNIMIKQIREFIGKIKEKASIEKRLKEEEIKNLEVTNLLHKSELKFLQSQINPHFLFNTMNTISTLAQIEGAEETQKMLESMSSILRYNLKKANENVTLKEEYAIVLNYLYIQKVRFKERFEFILDVDESTLSYQVPSMILQPFVENAIIHGLEPREGKGILEIKIRQINDKIEILVKDNGLGISEEKLQSLLDYDIQAMRSSNGGIGVINVMRRLEIIYGKNAAQISSQLGDGTQVKMSLGKIYM